LRASHRGRLARSPKACFVRTRGNIGPRCSRVPFAVARLSRRAHSESHSTLLAPTAGHATPTSRSVFGGGLA
jgi:hypothetical protein